MENWTKALLHSYRFLQNLATTIDEKVKQITLGSMVYNSKSNSDTMSQFDTIIALNDRKLSVVNLKVITENCVNVLKQKELEVISLYYLDGVDIIDICETLDISLRTFYRRKELGINRIAEYLRKNYKENYFLHTFSQETWLIDLYKYYVRKSKVCKLSECTNDESVLNGKEIFSALKEIRKIAI